MIYGGCAMVFAAIPYRYTTWPWGFLIALTLVAYSIIVTIIYVSSRNVIFHQSAYAVLVCLLALIVSSVREKPHLIHMRHLTFLVLTFFS